MFPPLHMHIFAVRLPVAFYYFMVKSVISREGDLLAKLQWGIDAACQYYRSDLNNYKELGYFSRLFDLKHSDSFQKTRSKAADT